MWWITGALEFYMVTKQNTQNAELILSLPSLSIAEAYGCHRHHHRCRRRALFCLLLFSLSLNRIMFLWWNMAK
ncbi:hypothetical protein P8452_01606 [Trifolium repens]|nr:hypothetical protein P8452_01606 [Trifolium repens]